MLQAKEVKFEDYEEVVAILQSISAFIPSREMASEIWSNFNSQDSLKGFSFFFNNEIVGYGSIFYEVKIRGGKAGHIEDIVIKDSYRGKGFGKMIIDFLVKDAKNESCYKISLSCKEHNVVFYKKCGFKQDGVTMQLKL